MSAGSGLMLLSEVIGALSYALDLTEGEPPGHATRSCVIGMRLAEELELNAATRSDLFYALLLKDAGCTANAARMAALFGADDHELKHTAKRSDWSDPFSAFIWSVRSVAPGQGMRARLDRLLAIKDEGEVTRSLMEARCERGAEIALMVGLSERTADAIRTLDEHWDGQGQPRGLTGDEIPLLGRILCLAQTVEIFHAAGGIEGAYGVAERRSGRWFDPVLVDTLGAFRDDDGFWASLGEPDLSRWEPPDQVLMADDESQLALATAFAAIVDAKSPWTYHHSDRTSLIATNMGAALGFDQEGLGRLRRVGLLHDIGKLAISNRILDKPARLTGAEFARIKEHPLVSERIIAQVPGCEHLAPVAGAHHERLDGSGYPRGLSAAELTTPMRVLAVADVYEALTSERPYRPALSSETALDIIREDVPGRFDRDTFTTLERLLADERDAMDVLGESRDARRARAVVLDPNDR
jgi:HD-GYP domain-containing protein (c-di-GMP phosphodiesterase class II)